MHCGSRRSLGVRLAAQPRCRQRRPNVVVLYTPRMIGSGCPARRAFERTVPATARRIRALLIGREAMEGVGGRLASGFRLHGQLLKSREALAIGRPF